VTIVRTRTPARLSFDYLIQDKSRRSVASGSQRLVDTARTLSLDFLKQWIDKRVEDITIERTPNPEKTMAWYWIKNAGDSKHFSKKAIVFECFHNFVAFSQWGNTIFGVMSRLSENGERNQQFDSLTVDS
jgi:hypothetical protein